MNLSEINWEFDASGTWPLPVKAAMVVVLSLIVMGAGYYYDTMDQLDQLNKLEAKENELKKSFASKQEKAVNLPEYVKQLEQIQGSLGEMLRQMPTEEEVASLLVDISQTGLASGLSFRLFRPAAPVKQEFYSELPIDIQVVGHYEELGLFVSGLASLPRIVTVHNVAITPIDKSQDQLMLMNAVVKTYKEDADTQVDEKNSKKKKKGNEKKKGAKK